VGGGGGRTVKAGRSEFRLAARFPGDPPI
jgi:hypothetical protein